MNANANIIFRQRKLKKELGGVSLEIGVSGGNEGNGRVWPCHYLTRGHIAIALQVTHCARTARGALALALAFDRDSAAAFFS